MSTDRNPSNPLYPRLLTVLFLLAGVVCLLTVGALAGRDRFLTRGVPQGLPQPIADGGARIGVNVHLEKYGDELPDVVDDIRATGIRYVKQPFYFSDNFDWAVADRIVNTVAAEGLVLVPLLDGDPASGFAPPNSISDYATWVGEFAARYGDQIAHYIIWDEPNLSSHWGGEPVNPATYAALLAAAAEAIRAVDSDAVIVAGPLAPTTESGPDNLSETLFLQALYEADAGDSFDIVAAKPYGFDTGPDDRTVSNERLNFSRPILLREVMDAHGDGDKAIWAGNWGWNSLPVGWSGSPSIWGQTGEATRAGWTVAALERARREWPWMGIMFLENWEPDAAADDPRWGFSIAGRPTADSIASYLATLSPDIAMPGFHPASPDSPSQQFAGNWKFSPEFGADIGQSGDLVQFTFWGTDIGVRVRRADFRARFYATVDGLPANALPSDEQGTTLVLTSPDPNQDTITTEWIARDLSPGLHTLELVASRGWDQWALNGFSVGYTPASITASWIPPALVGLAILFFSLALFFARRAAWGEPAATIRHRFNRLSDRAQIMLAGGIAAVVVLTGWLTWGPDALGIYRRLGDAGQLIATAAAATVFYVTPSFIIFTLALACLYFLLVLRPAWGLALITLTMPFYVPPLPKLILGYRFSPVELFTLLTLAAWLTRTTLDAGAAARRDGWRFRLPKLQRPDWAVIAFFLVACLSLFFTALRDVAITEWRVVILEPFLFYFLIRAIRPIAGEMWVILDAFVLSGVIVACYGLWQYFTGQNLITAEGGLLRLRSIYGSPNNVGLYLDRLLPLLLAMWLLGKRVIHGRRRVAYLLAIPPVALALLLTFSKGALLLGMPAAILVVFWVWQRQAGRRTWPWVILAMAGGIAALLVAGRIPAVAARLDLFGMTGFFRLSLWRSAVNMFMDHPWFGVGLDNFLYAYRGRYILDAAWQEPNLNHPHNIILDFATRLGLLGLLAGGWMIWETGRSLLKNIRLNGSEWLPVAAGFGGSLAAMLAHGLVDHSFFLVDLAFVFFLILGVSVWMERTAPVE